MVPERLQAALAAAPVVSDLDAIDPDLPLVANTGLTFLEIDQEADAELTARLTFSMTGSSDRNRARYCVRELRSGQESLSHPRPGRPLLRLYREHRAFLALGAYNHPQGWLLKKLDRDGANLHLIGVYRGITEEAQLYEVTVLKATCPARP